jgi:bifunctional non-homologous end joining protein LigD
MGKVGTGWSPTVYGRIRKQLDTAVSQKSKLTKPFKKPKAKWVEPKFYAEIEHRDITSEGCCAPAPSRDCPRGTSLSDAHVRARS